MLKRITDVPSAIVVLLSGIEVKLSVELAIAGIYEQQQHIINNYVI